METLRPADSVLKGAPWRPADSVLKGAPWRPADSVLKGAPLRLLNRGPDLRRQSEPRRLSAVERLEADKVKYVKSQQVALTKQAPIIRKALLPPSLICPGQVRSPPARHARSPPALAVHRHSSRSKSTGRRGAALDLHVLNDLISDVCSPSSVAAHSASSSSSGVENHPDGGRHVSPITTCGHAQLCPAPLCPTPLCPAPLCPAPLCPTPPAAAVRRVDVRPQVEVRTPQRVTLLAPALPPRSPASPCLTRLSNASSRGSAPRKRPSPLHRSQSDLSERFSRASADRERFFFYCGVDPALLRGEEPARASSLRSVSTDSSEDEEPAADRGERGGGERVPYGISVIERNARVIKWLYGLRQATGGAADT